MIIKHADIQLASQHQQRQHQSISESLSRVAVALENTENTDSSRPKRSSRQNTTTAAASAQSTLARQSVESHKPSLPINAAYFELSGRGVPSHELSTYQTVDYEGGLSDEFNLLKGLVEYLSGRKINLLRADFMASQSVSHTTAVTASPTTQNETSEATADFQLHFHRESLYSESEATRFQASGSLELIDGQRFEINLYQTLQYHYQRSDTLDLTLNNSELIDPLIINTALFDNANFDGTGFDSTNFDSTNFDSTRFDNTRFDNTRFTNTTPAFDTRSTPVSLTRDTFSFDLNVDGYNEQIVMATGNSAFLALDKNGDGTINNGSELFGALSGDGFAELATYDEDGNGFIDAGDSVYSQLLLFNTDFEGNNQLRSLQDVAAIALYLDSQETPFAIKNKDNELIAAVRASSLYVDENGRTGAVHMIDLAV